MAKDHNDRDVTRELGRANALHDAAADVVAFLDAPDTFEAVELALEGSAAEWFAGLYGRLAALASILAEAAPERSAAASASQPSRVESPRVPDREQLQVSEIGIEDEVALDLTELECTDPDYVIPAGPLGGAAQVRLLHPHANEHWHRSVFSVYDELTKLALLLRATISIVDEGARAAAPDVVAELVADDVRESKQQTMALGREQKHSDPIVGLYGYILAAVVEGRRAVDRAEGHDAWPPRLLR